jgi:hypothetical protein
MTDPEEPSRPKDKVKTSILIDAEVWDWFIDEMHRRRVSYSSGLQKLIEEFRAKQFVQRPGPGIETAASNQADVLRGWSRTELHDMLEEILDKGTKHVAAIVQNLELLAFSMDLVGQYTPEELREMRRARKAASKPKKKSK